MPKAIIRKVAKPDECVTCNFNPKEYTISKRNSWNPKKNLEDDVPDIWFGGGEAQILTMDLFFDTYEARKDVREVFTNKIWGMMAVEKEKDTKHPPQVEFLWGGLSFNAVILSINQKFTMFNSEGKPVRSTMSVTFQQCGKITPPPPEDERGGKKPGFKVRIVKQGETIEVIAHQEYGDPSKQRLLADANQIDDPLKIRAGDRLTIPPLR